MTSICQKIYTMLFINILFFGGLSGAYSSELTEEEPVWEVKETEQTAPSGPTTVANNSSGENKAWGKRSWVSPDGLKMESHSPGPQISTWQVTGVLFGIIALILGIGYFLKRFGAPGLLNHGLLKVVAILPLGGRERVALIQVGDKQVLVGIAQGQITRLDSYETPIQTEPSVPSDFSRKLQDMLSRSSSR